MRLTNLLVVLPLLILAGCGGGDKSTKPVVPPSDGLPDGTPQADSPAHLMQRLEATWESEVEAQYELLLTNDFRYTFSAAADPELANLYPNWGRTDEVTAITHLFTGFVNTSGTPISAASLIDMTLNGVQQGTDLDHADSTAYYQRIIVTSLDAVIEVPVAGSDPIFYHISSRHEYFLVRGDAAVLPSGTSPDSTRWYLRRWDDLSPPPPTSKGPVINPAQPKTLGSIRAQYRS